MSSIKEARLKKHLTQEEAAKAIGISYSMYTKIETGNRGASGKMMKLFSDFFGETVDELFFKDYDWK